jgi:hypothetical protein
MANGNFGTIVTDEIVDILESQGIADITKDDIGPLIFGRLTWKIDHDISSDAEKLAGSLRVFSTAELETDPDDVQPIFVFHYEPVHDSSEPLSSLQRFMDRLKSEEAEHKKTGNDGADNNENHVGDCLKFNKRSLQNKVENIYFYNIVSDRVSFNESSKLSLAVKQSLKDYVNKIYDFDIPNVYRIKFNTILIPSEDNLKRPITIPIVSRVRALDGEAKISHKPNADKTELYLKCTVYTASLNEIVKLYEQVGESLFDQNLRYRIKEQNDVENAMGATIQNQPQMFWFLNNGISLIVTDSNRIERGRFDAISINLPDQKHDDLDTVSIVNGAQTISSCFSIDEAEFNKDLKVLLRVYTFVRKKGSEIDPIGDSLFQGEEKQLSADKVDISNKIDEITIALNRQKPIRPDDLAFASDFVRQMNSVQLVPAESDEREEQENRFDKTKFEIVRRGDKESIFLHKYSLISFARIMEATGEEPSPGKARSSGSSTLLKQKDGKFIRKEIFFETDGSDTDFYDKYITKYAHVNLAFKVSNYVDTHQQTSASTTFKDSNDMNALINNGKYYLISYLVKRLTKNEKFEADPSEEAIEAAYNNLLSSINKNLTEIKNQYYSEPVFESQRDSGKDPLVSNDFKKDILFSIISKCLEPPDIS